VLLAWLPASPTQREEVVRETSALTHGCSQPRLLTEVCSPDGYVCSNIVVPPRGKEGDEIYFPTPGEFCLTADTMDASGLWQAATASALNSALCVRRLRRPGP
jgi:hypothetical protein